MKGVCEMAIDEKKIEEHIRGILQAIGENTEREGLLETPSRVAKMFKERFEGIGYSNHEIASMFQKTFADNTVRSKNNCVIVKDIDAFSYCEHHIALIYDMKITVAYLPVNKIIGLSKIVRIVDMVCKRLQVQERIGEDIADIIEEITESRDIAILIEAKHSCVSSRGIKNVNCTTFTKTLRGKFQDEVVMNSYISER